MEKGGLMMSLKATFIFYWMLFFSYGHPGHGTEELSTPSLTSRNAFDYSSTYSPDEDECQLSSRVLTWNDCPSDRQFSRKILENDTLSYRCNSSQIIKVLAAEYKGQQQNVLDIECNFCDNLQSCAITAVNDTTFPDHCAENSIYFLNVSYRCNYTDTDGVSYQLIRKLEDELSLTCENGVIVVEFARYIASSIHCKHCDRDGWQLVSNRCTGQSNCSFPVRASDFGDPCTFKSYLDINLCCLDVVCPEINGIQIFWPETPAGKTAESQQRCPVHTVNRGRLPFATRQCVLREQQWGPVNLTNCGRKEEPGVDSLSKTPVTIGNAEAVAEALANVIEDLVDLAEDVDIVAVQKTVVNIVNVGSSSPDITRNVIRTINCLINANISASSERDPDVANSSSLILKAFETQISQTLKDHGTFNSTKPNIVVQGVTVNETQTEARFKFEIASTNSGSGDSNIEGQIRSISIEVPKDALIGSSDTRVSFVGYNDDTLFRSNMLGNTTDVLGPIISANVLGKNIGNLSQQQQVVIRMKPSQVKEAVLNTSRCVYWDFSLRAGIGDWAEDGCVLVAADSEGITCSCNHLTNFAVLVDFAGQGGEQTEPGALTFALDIISKVGCAVSIVALCITLLIFLLSSRLRMSLQRKILIQFCFAMLLLYLSFLIGIDSQSKSGCLFAGLLLHYFVLSTMFWMGVEARHMYITLVSESDRVGRHFMRKAGVFAWGGALIPVLVVLAVKQDEYLANAYCFVAPDYGLYFGLLCPIAVVILHNTITFVFVAKTLMSAKSYALKPDLEADATDNTDAKEVAQRLLNAFAVSVILGLTWAFGFLAIEEARGAFQLLFCIFNSFQGVLIFILFCYAQKDVRKLVFDKCCAEAVPHPKVKKPKQAIDAAGNPIPPGPATSMSSSTRVTGESYSDDNDTLVTKVDDATLAVTTTETTQQNDLEEVELQTTSADVEQPEPKESVGKDDEALIPNSIATEETNIST